MIVAAAPNAPAAWSLPDAPDPLREAAQQLHRQFVSEMLKQAKLADALGAADTGTNLGGALASVALDRIAADVTASQPGFTDSLYAALRRAAPEGTAT